MVNFLYKCVRKVVSISKLSKFKLILEWIIKFKLPHSLIAIITKILDEQSVEVSDQKSSDRKSQKIHKIH